MRMEFIRKVYLILSSQLLVTAVFIWLSCSNFGYKHWIQKNIWLIYVSIIVSLVTFYPLIYFRELARSVPINFILLFLFTISEGVIISLTTLRYDPQTVLNAALLTLALVVALTAYAFKSSTDFTMMGGILYILLVTLLMVTILGFFFPSKLFRTIISGFGVILFSFYLIYDTQLMLGNGSLALTIDDYIFAALNLYLDIINLFLYILSLLGDSNN